MIFASEYQKRLSGRSLPKPLKPRHRLGAVIIFFINYIFINLDYSSFSDNPAPAFPVDLKIFPHSVLPLTVPASFPSLAYILHKVPSSPEVISEILHRKYFLHC